MKSGAGKQFDCVQRTLSAVAEEPMEQEAGSFSIKLTKLILQKKENQILAKDSTFKPLPPLVNEETEEESNHDDSSSVSLD